MRQKKSQTIYYIVGLITNKDIHMFYFYFFLIHVLEMNIQFIMKRI